MVDVGPGSADEAGHRADPGSYTKRFDTMTHYESAIDEIAGRLQGTDASLTSSVAEILAAALPSWSRQS